MDSDLEIDLAEVLDGVDPLELLLEDPTLYQVAGEVLYSFHHNQNEVEESHTSPSSFQSDASETGSTSIPSPPDNGEAPAKKSTDFAKYAINRAICQACQSPARGYRYYGAVVCNSCRAFFSRATKGDSYLTFICVQVNLSIPCSINTKSWNFCQKCRFDNCLRIGMKLPNNSVNKRVVKEPIQRKNCWDMEPVRDALSKTRTLLGPADKLTKEEKMYLEALVTSQMKKSCEDIVTLVCSNMDIFKANMEFFYHGKTYPLHLEKQCEDYMNYSVSKSFEDDGKFCLKSVKLKQKDRNRLLHANFPLVLEFLLACKLNNKISSRQKDIESYFEIVKSSSSDPEYRRTVNNIHSQVTQNGNLKPIEATYENVYDPDQLGLSKKEESDRHFVVAKKLSEIPAGGTNDWDPVLCTLIVSVMMYSQDFIELDDACEVGKAQTMYAYILQRYLTTKVGTRSLNLFRESMLVPSYARELRETRERALRKMGLVK